MTPDKHQKIQEQLNNCENVISIAKQEDMLESDIRYHISAGKLKKIEPNSQIE